MFGWKQRYTPMAKPPLLPTCLDSSFWSDQHVVSPLQKSCASLRVFHKESLKQKCIRNIPLLLCFVLTYFLSLFIRLLEVPFWYNPEYSFSGEYLLATHDAYHWVAGAEGFEFATGHPMSTFLAALSALLGMLPPNLAFWLPPFITSFVAVAICLWAWGLGRPYSGLCAGLLVSLSPAIFARTQLGFYDNDFFVLLFVLLIGIVPALWLHPWLKSLPDFVAEHIVGMKNKKDLSLASSLHKANTFSLFWEKTAENLKEKAFAPTLDMKTMEQAMLSWPWLLALASSGVFGHWSQDWHSFFPYYIRFSALIMPVLILALGPIQGRSVLLKGALCHAFPLLLGWPGFIIALLLGMIFCFPSSAFLQKRARVFPREEGDKALFMTDSVLFFRRLSLDYRFLFVLWIVIIFLCFDLSIFKLMRDSFLAYTQRGGDIAVNATAVDPLVFPSVAESIIETQTVGFNEFLQYFYPSNVIVALSSLALIIRLIKTPVMVWFLPFLGLFFLSRYMGARMTMFGPPAFALCLCLEAGWLAEKIGNTFFHASIALPKGGMLFQTAKQFITFMWSNPYGKLLMAIVCALFLVSPLVMTIPYQSSNGPIISKEQAEALRFIKLNTPKDSIVWNWWDWGYATHHFSRRTSIADGARHGGPSLYLPAAVYTTGDPRFARQVIKYTALKNNNPGSVFEGLTASKAQDLMVELGDKSKSLIVAPGKQYLVVSYDIVTIGAWISSFGSWNFNKAEMHPCLLSSISQGDINFNSDTGTILYNTDRERHSVQAGSVSIFSPRKLQRYIYQPREKSVPPFNRHFIFDVKDRSVQLTDELKNTLAYKFWEYKLGRLYLFSAVSNKLLMDSVFYNTMMVQLLVSDKNDQRITPFFKCVFDNIYCRVYEVL